MSGTGLQGLGWLERMSPVWGGTRSLLFLQALAGAYNHPLSHQGQADTDLGGIAALNSWGQELVVSSYNSIVCFVFLTAIPSLSSFLDEASPAPVANRPATYKHTDLEQVICPPDLGFSDSDGHPAWLWRANSLSVMCASGRPPVLFNIRERGKEAFEAEVPRNRDKSGPAPDVTVFLPVCLPVCLLGTFRSKALKPGQFKAAKANLPLALFVPRAKSLLA